jgi:acyl-CoA dehydrogenase
MIALLFVLVLFAGALALASLRAPFVAWAAALVVWVGAAFAAAGAPQALQLGAVAVVLALSALFVIPGLRRTLITKPVFAVYRSILPPMSETEKTALEAGSVWWEGELFSGKPTWNTLLNYPWPQLTPEERSFLDNETEALCRLMDDWETTHLHQDMSPECWQYVKDKGFLGMIIPKEYGGKGFSAFGHAQVITKLATRSSASAISVMVPNSLGPAELLLHYGARICAHLATGGL